MDSVTTMVVWKDLDFGVLARLAVGRVSAGKGCGGGGALKGLNCATRSSMLRGREGGGASRCFGVEFSALL